MGFSLLNFQMKLKILLRFKPKSTNGLRKAAVILIFLRVRVYPMKNTPNRRVSRSGEHATDLETRLAVVPAFIYVRVRGNRNTCRPPKTLVIRKILAVCTIEF
jgi:hypothetical protein